MIIRKNDKTMELRRAWRFELDPSDRTRTLLAKHAGAARFAWNWSLARRIELFTTQEGKAKFTNAQSEHADLVRLKATEWPWMHEVSKCAPQEALRDLDKAFGSFWARRKQGVGFPRFKKKHASRDSFRLYGAISPQSRYVKLPRLGVIRVKEKIAGRIAGRILNATVSREADRWFVSFATVEEVDAPKRVEGARVGVDLGITTFATLSDGIKIAPSNPLKASLERLRRAQRVHARKKKGSNNRRKSAQRIARIHARVAHARKDFIHRFTTKLAKTKSVIVIEDLNVKGMSKNRSLARSVLDQGWGEVRRQLVYKTKWYGSMLIVTDRFFASSKLCSACGLKRTKLSLSMRHWQCEGCQVVHDRDENAAKNLQRYPECQGNQTPVEMAMTAERGQPRSTSQPSRKQEANCEGISSRVTFVNADCHQIG